MKKLWERRGYALTELLLAVVLSMSMFTIVFVIYGKAKDKNTTVEVVHAFLQCSENVRTYYIFDGKYTGLSSVRGTDFYKRAFFPRSWSCKDKTCTGPDGISASLASANSGDAFSITINKVKRDSCIELATSDWRNIKTIQVNNSTYTGANVPLSGKNAIQSCNKSKNSLVVTLF